MSDLPINTPEEASRRDRGYLILSAVATAIAVTLVAYSQTQAFTWDEGFHLLAARFIAAGKRPYIDFCFPQTPLNAYWNALWMWIAGDNWRVTHIAAALVSSATVFLVADFLYTRFPVARWRLPVSIAGALLCGLNALVFGFGTIAQAYAMAMCTSMAGFRLTILAAGRNNILWAFAAGLFGCAAPASTLLSATVSPVLLVWMFKQNRIGKRFAKAASFIAGGIAAFVPLLWLYTIAPAQTLFNVITYQGALRRVNWAGATMHDIEALSSWIDNSQALILGAFAVAGVVFLLRSNWSPQLRSEFLLSAWVSCLLVLYLCTPHPTFTRYFVVAVPFLAILASTGFYAAASRLSSQDRPGLPLAFLSILIILGLAKAVFNERDSYTWKDFETLAKKVNEVTPPGHTLYANELVYFAARRPVPPGMEFMYARKLQLPAWQARLFDVYPQAKYDQEIKTGSYQTVVECDDDRIDALKLPTLYRQKEEIAECTVFWDRK